MQRSLLITGCSSGIGYDFARTFQARGWRVFATCRKQEDCDRLIAEGFESFRLDHTCSDSIGQAVATLLERTGGTLDALVLNGAHALPCAVEDTPRDALREIFEVNLFGPFEIINRVLPVMRAQGHGRIVNVSSILGFVSVPFRGPYCGTKYAMEGMTGSLRQEVKRAGIHVSLLQPGPVTSLIRQNAVPHFERWVAWENSALRNAYKKSVVPRLYTDKNKPDRFELPASSCSKKLIHALEHPRPKARYLVTTPTYIADILRRFLPVRLMDRILARS